MDKQYLSAWREDFVLNIHIDVYVIILESCYCFLVCAISVTGTIAPQSNRSCSGYQYLS